MGNACRGLSVLVFGSLECVCAGVCMCLSVQVCVCVSMVYVRIQVCQRLDGNQCARVCAGMLMCSSVMV